MPQSYRRLLENNRAWAAQRLEQDPEYFERMARGQAPQHLLIGCSDSRVPPNELTQTEPGDLFIHRNVANLVVHTDLNLMSVLQFAVEVLRVKHVVVMGHYGCGGIVASQEQRWHGLIDEWLRNIKDVYRLHRDELDAITDQELRLRRLVELNVREQVYNLYKSSILQRAWASTGGMPQVHGWVYEMKTGLIHDIQDQLQGEWQHLRHIYDFGLER